MLQNHTDITSLKKDNLEILNIKIKAIEIDKLITTGYTILPQRIKTFIEHMNIGDIAIIRLLSVADAKKNPNKPFIIKTQIKEKLKLYNMNSDNMKGHKRLFLPFIKDKYTKVKNFPKKNPKHSWMNEWNENTENILAIKVEKWNESDIYTYNNTPLEFNKCKTSTAATFQKFI